MRREFGIYIPTGCKHFKVLLNYFIGIRQTLIQYWEKNGLVRSNFLNFWIQSLELRDQWCYLCLISLFAFTKTSLASKHPLNFFFAAKLLIWITMKDIIYGTFWSFKKIYDNFENSFLCKLDGWFTECSNKK